MIKTVKDLQVTIAQQLNNEIAVSITKDFNKEDTLEYKTWISIKKNLWGYGYTFDAYRRDPLDEEMIALQVMYQNVDFIEVEAK